MTERENLYTTWLNEDGTQGMDPLLIHDRAKMAEELAENQRRNAEIRAAVDAQRDRRAA